MPAAAAVLEAAGHPAWLAAGLARRGVTDADAARAFLDPTLEQLGDPLLLPGVAEALERLARARADGDRVAVVGDYDVDGVAASALLLAVLRACGVEVRPILPRRLQEGYGFQPVHVERAVAAGCALIVTADCGSTALAAAEAAAAAGLGVIVTDHHLSETPLPESVIEINPRRHPGEYPFTELCGAGVAYRLATAFAARCEREIPAASLLRVACLGTIADMVPLRGENRVIAALGLRALPDTPSPGLQALFRLSGVRPPLTAADVGYRLGPRINAIGRMHEADEALDLLLTRDRTRASTLAAELERWNHERRRTEAAVVEEAGEMFRQRRPLPALLIGWSARWHPGVVGVAAGRMAREHRRPAILLAVEGGLATGSGRSVPGLDLFRFLLPWRDEMERFGGHAQAVGLSVPEERLAELARGWEAAAASWDDPGAREGWTYELHPEADALGEELLAAVVRLGPFGAGNPEPLLRVGPLALEGAPRIFGRGHLQARAVSSSGAEVHLLGWGWEERLAELEGRFEALGYYELDRYRQRPVLRLMDSRAWRG